MGRSVRIFGTFGPTLHTKEQICAMIGAGMSGIRLNLSHTSLDGARPWIENLRLAEKKTGKKIEKEHGRGLLRFPLAEDTEYRGTQ